MLDLSDIEGLFNSQMKGWTGIDEAGKSAALARNKEQAEQREEYLSTARTMARAFETEAGRAALGVLFKMTIGRPPSEEELGCATEFQYVRAKALRDGQNNILFQIIQMIRVASEGMPASAATARPRAAKRKTGGKTK